MTIMKRLTLIVILLLVSLSAQSGYALNLTPLKGIVTGDGPPQERHYFQDDDKRLGFRIDKKMTVTGSAMQADFSLTDLASATIKLRKSPASPGIPFDPKGFESYKSVAHSLLPAEVTNLTMIDAKPGAISINGWKSVQFTYSYTALGKNYKRSITFLNFTDTQQYIFDVSAALPDYGKAYARGYNVLNSLYELPLKASSGPT
jgi:hypothetical protein